MARSVGRTRTPIAIAVIVAVAALAVPSPAPAQVPNPRPMAPWNGEPVSPGLGPTYGEAWCAQAASGSSIANQQGSPLALIPSEAIECTLESIEAEAAAKGLPDRMDRFVIGHSAGGHDIHAVVINALETPEQERDYERWVQIRNIEKEDPPAARELLDSFGDDVKIPIFIQGNIHGNEEEGADAAMQVIRDLVTLERGASEIVDDILDHSILVMIPSINPDGRRAGTRANGNGFDMNRDWLVQSQSEVRASAKLQQEWLATVGLDLHGYVNPTLIDGLTKPHNPGIEYDTFLRWNQSRLDANESALLAIGMPITRPVNHYNPLGVPPGHPYVAEGWDDWGPFYTQTYMAFYGVDSSTVEMCTSPAGGACDGRLGSKTSSYLAFYSSVEFWLANRQDLMRDQLENFRRGVDGEERLGCCADPTITARGFTEDQHNWMVEYPTAYVIPFESDVQRSDAEANRLVQWLLDNGIAVTQATSGFEWNGTAYPAGSYVVWMDQALRGLALTALSPGQDISDRITQLYAPPAAWSHGLLWGADVFEVSRDDATFSPETTPIDEPNALQGGVRDRRGRPPEWYSVTLRGVSEYRVMLDLLRDGVAAEIAEEPFESSTGGAMPAGTIIIPWSGKTQKLIENAGRDAGVHFELDRGVEKPATSALIEAPNVAVLVNSANPSRTDTSESLRAIFGENVGFVSVSNGPNSLANAPDDPLQAFDVIYNAGQGWPSNSTAQNRLNAFFERGGGYIGTSQSSNNFAFLSNSGLVEGALTQGSQSASGGIAVWNNTGASDSPLTGGYPSEDFLYLPSSVTYFTSTPSGATVAGTYHSDMTGSGPNGPSEGFVAGHWRTRQPAANDAPVIVHGATDVGSRYLGFATNPFSRQDAEREWALIAQAVLWSNLTDDLDADGAEAAASGRVASSYPDARIRVDPPSARPVGKIGTRGAD